MPSSSTSRLEGLTTSVAVKAPCRVATTANITLSGLQTIDGVSVAADDRVLVRSQTDTAENGIYKVSASEWDRAKDFDGSLDAVNGTLVFVSSGDTLGTNMFRLSSTDPVEIGTSALAWVNLGPTLDSIGHFTPEQFGATGDGVTDDTAAFVLLSAAINAAGGGIVQLAASATYLVGSQAAGNDYYLFGSAVLDIADCESFTLHMNGATMKNIAGLKYGTFNTGTGAAQDYGVPYTVKANAATAGVLVQCIRVGKVRIEGGSLHGNSQNLVVGGRYGDAGRQLAHSGVYIGECENVVVENIDARYFGLDCFTLVWNGITTANPPMPAVFRNCTGDYAGRNTVSVTGGNQIEFDNCVFERGGEAPATVTVPAALAYISSSPASCFDIEQESAGGIIRNLTIRNSRLLSGANSNTAVVADSGDSADITIENCVLGGAVWLKMPRCRVLNSTVNGIFSRLLGAQTNIEDNSLIEGCTITDTPLGEDTAFSGNMIDCTGAGAGVRIRNSVFRCTTTTLVFRSATMFNVKVDWRTGTGSLADLGTAIQLNGADVERLEITDNITTSIPATGYAVEVPNTQKNSKIISASSKLKWKDATTGYAGKLVNARYASYNPASIAANTALEVAIVFDVAVSGAKANLSCYFAGLNSGVVLSAYATDTTNGFIRFNNITTGAIDPAAAEMMITEVG